MQVLMSLFIAVLFVALTPGVLLTLPKGGSKMTVALVHGLVFAVVFHLTHKTAMRMLYEGFQAEMPGAPKPPMAMGANPPKAKPMGGKAPYGKMD